MRSGRLIYTVLVFGLTATCGAQFVAQRPANAMRPQDKALFDAIWSSNGDPSRVEEALRHKPNLEARNDIGQTPLFAAVFIGSVEIVQLLLDHHANIEAKDMSGNTPLMDAVIQNRPAAAESLLKNHADVGAKNKSGETVLQQAITDITLSDNDPPETVRAKMHIVEMLLANGADPNIGDRIWGRPLEEAIGKNKPQLVRLLLQYHADAGAALDVAIRSGRIDMVQLLLDAHANAGTALDAAISSGKIDMVQLLLDAHADPNTSQGTLPLIAAIDANRADIVALLLRYHANVEAKDKDGLTPLWHAVEDKQPVIVRQLVDAHADPRSLNAIRYGQTALTDAVRNNQLEMVKLLIAIHVDIEARNDYGETPLMVAASDRDVKPEMLATLIAAHANIEAKNEVGRTALSLAAAAGKLDAMEALLKAKANLETTDKYGNTPLAWAVLYDNPDAVRFLIQHRANRNIKDSKGQTLAERAAGFKYCDVVEVLQPGNDAAAHECFVELVAAYQSESNEDRRNSELQVIGRTVAGMVTPPEVPEDARRPFVQANTVYKSSQSNSDLNNAIRLYGDALRQAPWFADAWYNQSLAQEKADDFKGAVASMKSFEIVQPGGDKDRATLDRIYALEAQVK